MIGTGPFGERTRVWQGAVQDADGCPTPRRRRCFTASEAIVPAPITTTDRPERLPSTSSASEAPRPTNASGAAPSDVS